MTKKQPIIFCDFDGTITETDNIIEIMKKFAPPEWEPIKDQILGQQISIREGVGKMFALLPSNLKEEITSFVLNQARIRPGFRELLHYCDKHEIQFLVTSGGIDFFVYPLLEPFGLTNRIYCNASDFSGDLIRILWPNKCDEHCDRDCGMCKTTILRSYDTDRYERIVIGDSITDLAASKLADHVFARAFLIEKCEELGIPYTPYKDFFDVIEGLGSIISVNDETEGL
jgi:2-hydroxy-3-keto-5-methylthiopentenyl-1-phosphate phosphatase